MFLAAILSPQHYQVDHLLKKGNILIFSPKFVIRLSLLYSKIHFKKLVKTIIISVVKIKTYYINMLGHGFRFVLFCYEK
jgi:hypothetical protein